MSNPQEYLAFATTLAYKAGDIMLEHFQIGIEKEDKVDGSPVTIADTKINQIVIDAIRKAYPEHAIHGEEASHKKEGAEYVWSCDPIDGTIPYTFGIPTSMFSLALVKNGEPIVGVLYDPYMKRFYQAVKGQGAYMNNEKLHVNQEKKLSGNYISLPSQTVLFFDAVGLRTTASKEGIKSLTIFCLTYEVSLVALGQFVGNIFGYSTAHDVAAVKVIIEEAGGKVTDLLGNEQRYDQPINGAIVSNGLVHDELVALVKPYLTI